MDYESSENENDELTCAYKVESNLDCANEMNWEVDCMRRVNTYWKEPSVIFRLAAEQW